jgi:hypothetical protein
MQVQLGKTYLTENGGTVKITVFDLSRRRPFHGTIVGGASPRPASFYQNGAYSEAPTGWDIISEIT